jgi:uncharacterized protein (DUF983 family)
MSIQEIKFCKVCQTPTGAMYTKSTASVEVCENCGTQYGAHPNKDEGQFLARLHFSMKPDPLYRKFLNKYVFKNQ